MRPQQWAPTVAPVTDWRDYDTAYAERYMERPSDNEAGYAETSVIPAAARAEDPFLLAWGTTDDNVHPVHSERWVDALIAAGRKPEVHVFPDRSHAIGDPLARVALFDALTRFFTRHLARLRPLLDEAPGARWRRADVTPGVIAASILLFALAALLEIGGGWLSGNGCAKTPRCGLV